jgi:2-succinyl-5-enolpyruvyl-6-hydroxy-3-cyclohexene-1-carboxylate synthase
VIVRLGGSLASRVVGEWSAASGAAEIVVAGASRWDDPHGTAAVVLAMRPEDLLDAWVLEAEGIEPVDDGAWATAWLEHGRAALAATNAALDLEAEPTEPGIARAVVGALPAGAALVASSSMPIRDLEWYARPTVAIEVHANRGTNGIDGVVSTAVGVALADPSRPTALLIGDVAFLHDANGLLGAAARGIDLVIVVVDNDGGGIFSFLPPADAVAPDRFELLYGTPHGLDLVALASAHGTAARRVTDVGPALADALTAGGVHVLVVGTDRAENVAVHHRLNAAVAEALAPLVE